MYNKSNTIYTIAENDLDFFDQQKWVDYKIFYHLTKIACVLILTLQ